MHRAQTDAFVEARTPVGLPWRCNDDEDFENSTIVIPLALKPEWKALAAKLHPNAPFKKDDKSAEKPLGGVRASKFLKSATEEATKLGCVADDGSDTRPLPVD